MSFAKEMLAADAVLSKFGHEAFLPHSTTEYVQGALKKVDSESFKRKIERNLIEDHYKLIQKSDAVLVLNYDKRSVSNYIGGSGFLEMGFAYILKKKIFLLNPIPDMEFIKAEIEAMQPIVLYGDLSLVR
jgi:nucleoside 2-deoxyribosyltransferase